MVNVPEQYVQTILTVWPLCFDSVAGGKEKNLHTYHVFDHAIQLSVRYCRYNKQHDAAHV
jgi:hypothetical protein